MGKKSKSDYGVGAFFRLLGLGAILVADEVAKSWNDAERKQTSIENGHSYYMDHNGDTRLVSTGEKVNEVYKDGTVYLVSQKTGQVLRNVKDDDDIIKNRANKKYAIDTGQKYYFEQHFGTPMGGLTYFPVETATGRQFTMHEILYVQNGKIKYFYCKLYLKYNYETDDWTGYDIQEIPKEEYDKKLRFRTIDQIWSKHIRGKY